MATRAKALTMRQRLEEFMNSTLKEPFEDLICALLRDMAVVRTVNRSTSDLGLNEIPKLIHDIRDGRTAPYLRIWANPLFRVEFSGDPEKGTAVLVITYCPKGMETFLMTELIIALRHIGPVRIEQDYHKSLEWKF